MNVIIANKNKSMLENLGVDIIKELEGEFDADTIVASFQNFFYQRMILDITALKDYTDIRNLQKLSISLPMEKLILLLDGTEVTSNPTFLSNLVSMGIYNFAKDVEGIGYLYNTPNSYRDVAQFHQLNTGVSDANNINNTVNTVVTYVNNTPNQVSDDFIQTRIIGVKNVTKQSGSTSLVYMMKKELSKNYSTLAIEMDKNDFTFLKDKSMISSNTSNIGQVISQNKDKEVIIIDLNNSMVAEGFCSEVLYLIEPSIIKLNKLLLMNAQALQGLKGKKVILNQSLLTSDDVSNFEYESRLKIYYNLVPLNERDKNLPELNKLLVKLGFSRQQNNI